MLIASFRFLCMPLLISFLHFTQSPNRCLHRSRQRRNEGETMIVIFSFVSCFSFAALSLPFVFYFSSLPFCRSLSLNFDHYPSIC